MGFTTVALLTLGLGIGATTIVFSGVYAVLIRPLPFRSADRIVAVWQHDPSRGFENNYVSPAEILAWRDESRVFEDLAAFAGTSCVLTGAILALILAALGVYSVLSYSVTQQTREIGVRVALGARRDAVLRLVLGDVARRTLIGIIIGAAAAWPLTALMKDLLFGVQAGDPLTVACSIVLLISASLVAAYVPARRALQADPIRALREG